MDHKPAVHALIRLHAECGGRIKENRLEANKLAEDMRHIEAVLKMLDPSFNARSISAKRKNTQNPFFRRGDDLPRLAGGAEGGCKPHDGGGDIPRPLAVEGRPATHQDPGRDDVSR